MAHVLSVSSRTLGVLLSSSLVLACNSEPKKALPATTAGATAAPVGGPPATDPTAPPPVDVAAPTGKVSLASGGTIHALTSEPEILGHFLIANSAQLLADVKTQLVTPRYAGFLEEPALRSIVSMALDKRSSMAQAFDLAAPLGCVLVDPKQPEPRVSCTFGYKGGVKAFVTDVGDENKAPDGSGHVAAYSVEGSSVFVDELAGQVVVSSGKDTFTTTQGYLQRNLIGRAGDVHGDLELVVYVANVFDRYRTDIDPIIAQISSGTATPPPTGNPAVDSAIQAFTGYQKKSSKQGIERISELTQFTMFFSVEPAGLMMGAAMFPKPGSRIALESAQYGGLKLDPSLAGLAPSGTAMLGAIHANPKLYEMPSAAELRKTIGEIWAPLSGRDAAAIEASVAAFQAENAALYDGQGVFSLAYEEGAPAAMMFASHLNAGQSARESWKAWTQTFTPDLVLGPNLSKYLTWKFTPDFATVDGVAVDRWTLEPGSETMGKISAAMTPESKVMVDKLLGGVFLHIDRAEVGGNVITTIAPKAEANFMKRSIAAAQGKGNVSSEPGLAKVLSRDPDAVGVFAVDVKQIMGLIKNLKNYGAKIEEMPPLGTDLGDFYITFRYATDGTSTMEFVIAQQFIEQIKKLIPN